MFGGFWHVIEDHEAVRVGGRCAAAVAERSWWRRCSCSGGGAVLVDRGRGPNEVRGRGLGRCCAGRLRRAQRPHERSERGSRETLRVSLALVRSLRSLTASAQRARAGVFHVLVSSVGSKVPRAVRAASPREDEANEGSERLRRSGERFCKEGCASERSERAQSLRSKKVRARDSNPGRSLPRSRRSRDCALPASNLARYAVGCSRPFATRQRAWRDSHERSEWEYVTAAKRA